MRSAMRERVCGHTGQRGKREQAEKPESVE